MRFGPDGDDAGHLALEADVDGAISISGVASSPSGEIAYAGYYIGTADLDAGSGADVRTGDAMFVTRLDAGGAYLTSHEFAGYAWARFMRFGEGGSLYVGGSYDGAQSFFGPTSDDVLDRTDEFLMKLDVDGSPDWVKTWLDTVIARHAMTSDGDLLIWKGTNTSDYEIAKLGARDGEPVWTLPDRAWYLTDVASGEDRIVILGSGAEPLVDFDPGSKRGLRHQGARQLHHGDG